MSGGNNNSTGDDALTSFTGLGGASGLDTDSMNIFSSFTNDTTTATANGGSVSGFANLAAGTIGGFGMDLGSFEMPGNSTSGSVDLSSMQLINLDNVPLGNSMNQGAATDDAAAQLMARLLGPNTQPAPAQQRGLGLSTGGGQTVNAQPPTGLRSGSESSDDLGDIPLAQLALGQSVPGSDNQNVAAMLQNQVAMQALANMGASAMPAFGLPAAQPTGMLGLSQPNQTVLNAALDDTLLAGLIPNNPPSMQQALPFLAPGAMPPATHMHGLERATGVGQQPFIPILANTLDSAPLEPLPAQTEMTGVHSSILPDTSLHTTLESTVNPNLELTLPRPPVDTNRCLLDELEKIEEQLCTLLGTASKAIRMMTGPRREEEDGLESGSAKIKPTIKEFMLLVADVQASMKYQHRRLTEQGISTQAVAGFQSDVAGFERDLVTWSDAARLLASALNSGLKLSASSSK
ncbi:hypothetical protein GGI19_000322 [Coemansia pectinata]|uniref:Mediator of RNA polymerase II transcription subunit 11 n=1 Tax=Coemansia pectinata TaxID=1052879 RepID=A0A9W8H381_9FUNG|nr:hypothetical protein GGI19_000322 [Coemansia pectinata]